MALLKVQVSGKGRDDLRATLGNFYFPYPGFSVIMKAPEEDAQKIVSYFTAYHAAACFC